MHLRHVVSTLAFAQAALATTLHKRAEERTRCDSPSRCVYSYTTGSAQCSSGFTRHHLEANGSPPGSYCERKCTDPERTACTANTCNSYEGQCHQYPGSAGLCEAAMKWCNGPVATLKSVCTEQNMNQKVTFDETRNLCIPEGKTADSRKATPLKKGFGANFVAQLVDPNLKTNFITTSCRDVSWSDIQDYAEVVGAFTSGCVSRFFEDEGNTGYSLINVRCEAAKDDWETLRFLFSQACWEYKPFRTDVQYPGPHFLFELYNGNPRN